MFRQLAFDGDRITIIYSNIFNIVDEVASHNDYSNAVYSTRQIINFRLWQSLSLSLSLSLAEHRKIWAQIYHLCHMSGIGVELCVWSVQTFEQARLIVDSQRSAFVKTPKSPRLSRLA